MLTVEKSGHAAVVTMSRPPVNAINNEWIERFGALLDGLESDTDIAVLHIRSDLRVFSAGMDLQQMRDGFEAADGADSMIAAVSALQGLYVRIERLPMVTVAEIGGAAMGGGLELALSCDLRTAANEARMGLPEAALGLVPGAGGTQRLTALCGRGVAHRLILGAEIVDGTEACALGIVQWAVPADQLAGWTGEVVARVADIPRATLASAKQCIAAQSDTGRDGFFEELVATRALYNDPETRRRVAAFLGRGKK